MAESKKAFNKVKTNDHNIIIVYKRKSVGNYFLITG